MARASPRAKACAARWEEKPDLPYWVEVIQRMNASAFCRGQNDRGWCADIEFFARPDSAAKILEGKYDRAAPPSPAAARSGTSEIDQQISRDARDAAADIVRVLPKAGRDQGERAGSMLSPLARRIVERQGGWHRIHELADDGNIASLQAQWRELGVTALHADGELGEEGQPWA